MTMAANDAANDVEEAGLDKTVSWAAGTDHRAVKARFPSAIRLVGTKRKHPLSRIPRHS